ncbi:MAG: saccharopine dehydrogenase NADP-binding domain-containing protein, partial [Gemmatimonadota bacterium]
MARVLIIGAGGVGSVVTHKCAQIPEVFADICLASRTLARCRAIQEQLPRPIQIAQVDADRTDEVAALIDSFRPTVVINV